MAVVFEDDDIEGGLMFESNLLGTHPKFFKNASKHMSIVHMVSIPLKFENEKAVKAFMVNEVDDKPYDILGAIYLGWWKLLRRIFKCALPKRNKWARKDAFFCDEIIVMLNAAGAGFKFDTLGVGMMSPYDVWKQLETQVSR